MSIPNVRCCSTKPCMEAVFLPGCATEQEKTNTAIKQTSRVKSGAHTQYQIRDSFLLIPIPNFRFWVAIRMLFGTFYQFNHVPEIYQLGYMKRRKLGASSGGEARLD